MIVLFLLRRVRTQWAERVPVSIPIWWSVRAELDALRPPPLRAGAAQFMQRRRRQLARCRAGFDQYDVQAVAWVRAAVKLPSRSTGPRGDRPTATARCYSPAFSG
jgi:hypothetical protein